MYIVVTYLNDEGAINYGELVTPFEIDSDCLRLIGRDGDPLVFTVATMVDDDLHIEQVERQRVASVAPMAV